MSHPHRKPSDRAFASSGDDRRERTAGVRWKAAPVQFLRRINPGYRSFVSRLWIGALGLLWMSAPPAGGFLKPESLPEWDRRSQTINRNPGTAERTAGPAIQQLRKDLPGLQIDYDPIRGTALHVRRLEAGLGESGSLSKGVSLQTLSLTPPGDPYRTLQAFVEERAELYGLTSGSLESKPDRELRSTRTGMRTGIWEQRYLGIPVFEAVMVGHLSRTRELLALSSTYVGNIEERATAWNPNHRFLATLPPVAAAEAVAWAHESLEEGIPTELKPVGAGSLREDLRQEFQLKGTSGIATVQLTWLPLSPTQLTLAWRVELNRKSGGERYQMLIDAQSGALLLRRCLTLYLEDATYEVFTQDSPSPLSPGFSSPDTRQPPLVPRSRVKLSATSTNASPLGWIADGENETRGNNVDAHLDLNADDYPDLPRPQGSPFRVFAPPLDLTQPAEENPDAAVVQLFYWCNQMHDWLYELGFDEASGNFQKDNFGRGGIGGDPVLADAQDGSGVNNANFTPSPDGEPGRIQMYVFDGSEPSRDGDLDAEIILHEYTHGLSTRLVGGGVGLTTLQAGGLGEGWSDFYALSFLSQSSDDPNACYAMGAYVTRLFFGLEENYYYGIRRYPYSTDLTKNPLTFKDIDPSQISPHLGIPRSPIFPFSPGLANEVHNQGEVWCVVLWEARARLIAKHGFEQGNRKILQWVTDGMKLSPPNPNFLQARDGILQAAALDGGTDDLLELWKAFAKRGLGFSATSPVSTTTSGIQEAFDLPDALALSQGGGFVFSGATGGPFFIQCQTLSLSNQSSASLSWVLNHGQSWIEVTPSSGQLEPHASTTVQICLRAEAAELKSGRYLDTLGITNLVSGVVQRRPLDLRLLQFTTMPFSDDFEDEKLKPVWLVSNPPYGRVRITSLGGPHGGKTHLAMDSDSDGLPARNEVTLGIDLRGWTNVLLHFWARGFSDEPNPPPPSPFKDGADFDGVALSTDGVQWYELQSLRNLGATNREFTVHLDNRLTQFGLSYGQYCQIRLNQFDNYPIPLDGIAIDDLELTGTPVGRFEVVLPNDVQEGDPTAKLGTLRLAVPAIRPIRFSFESTPAGILLPIPDVVVPTGATEVSFPLLVPDNQELDGLRLVSIRAVSPGYFGEDPVLSVADNETALITLSVPAGVNEGDETLERAGVVQVDRPGRNPLRIGLRSGNPKKLKVPEIVTIPAGRTTAAFDLTILDGQEIEGDVAVEIRAEVRGWVTATQSVIIHDNDSPTLRLIVPSSVSEGNPPTLGTVQLGGTVSSNVVVALISAKPNRLSVTNSTVVLAGQTDATFSFSAVDNIVADGSASVLIRASAVGFSNAITNILVLDDETPSLVSSPRPADGASNQPPTLTLGWRTGFGEILVNGDFETGTLEGWRTESESPSGWVINDGTVNPEGPDTPTPAFEGDFNVVLAQDGPGKHSIWQTVSLPAGAKSATLSWVDYIHNQGPEYFNPSQQYRVEIQDTGGNVLETAFATQPGDPLAIEWTHRSFDLTAYRGQTIRVAFAEEDLLGFINVGIDNVSVTIGTSGTTDFEVYFGGQSSLGPADRLGIVSTNRVTVTNLTATTRYYWQVVAVRGDARVTGPVWTFTTRGVGPLDHFEWDPLEPVQQFNQPFAARLTARDEFGFISTNFSGSVHLQARDSHRNRDTLLITEVDPGTDDQAEFTNVSEGPVDVSGWKFFFYDQSKWPLPRLTFTAPSGTVLDPGATFLIRESGKAPGSFPLFRLGTPVNWGFLSVGVPTAVLVMDSEDRFIDFFCAVDANAADITNPISIPPSGWSGAALPPINTQSNTWQRLGSRNHGSSSDWSVSPRSISSLNTGLQLPFEPAGSLPIAPATIDTFTNGVWTGSIAIQGAAPLVTLHATDGSNHIAYSTPIEIRAANDLSVQLVKKPTSPFIDQEALFVYSVSNSGPSLATGVTLRDTLPANAVVNSVQITSGSWVQSPGEVQWVIGSLPAGASATLQLKIAVGVAGSVTNITVLSANQQDPFLSNNRTEDRMDVILPLLVIQDTTVDEGDSGSHAATFVVRLSTTITRQVQVHFSTADDGATAGSDYVATSGVLIFPPGTTRQTIQVPILGDTLYEVQERFLVRLSDPVNAALGDAEAKGSIRDDETAPQVAIQNANVIEGNGSPNRVASVPVLLTSASSTPVAVSYFTANGTALAASDYVEQRGQLIFAVGVTQLAINIPIVGDLRPEPKEFFSVVLTNADGASVVVREGTVTILDDDATQLASLAWSQISPTQFVRSAFPVTLTALDALGGIVSGYESPATLRAFTQRRAAGPEAQSNFWEFPFRTYFHDARSQFIYPTNDLGAAGRISSLAFHLDSIPGQVLQDFTIRLKQGAASKFVQADWDNTGWTTVWASDLQVADPGWVRVPLEVPFNYDGLRPLWVDLSFDNSSYSSDGLAYFVETVEPRGRVFESDSAFGPPLQWSRLNPPARLTNRVAQIEFTVETPLSLSPEQTGRFAGGLWSGHIMIPTEASGVRLEAVADGGILGVSDLFDVIPEPVEDKRPSITRLEFRGPDLLIEFRGLADQLYQLEATDQIPSGTWVSVGQLVAGSPAGIAVLDVGASNRPKRFYRIRQH